MRKVINPCKCMVYTRSGREEMRNAFVKIEYNDSRLSITGVVAPMGNGDCLRSAGQCTEEIRNGKPTDEWTREMLDKLCDIWDKWHLNDMRPYCEHQKKLGWDELAGKKVTLYHYRLKREASDKQKEAEKAAIKALKEGIAFTPTEEQIKFANLSYAITSHEELNGELADYYEPKKPLYSGDGGATETKTLGWLREEEHPEGILNKPCPVCGYKYGSSWIKEEVPKDVIEWLESLPETKVKPAWV